MMKSRRSLLPFIIAMWVFAPALVQAGSGFYVSSELGVNFAPGVDITGFSNDRASTCDEYINPNYADSTKCTGPNRGAGDDWENDFDGATGILAGAAVGYSFAEKYPNHVLSGLRVEFEYFYRESEYDETSDIFRAAGASDDKLKNELVKATDRIGSITSHNLFGNLFYDGNNTSRFTPYIGVGAGVGFTEMDYGSLWSRKTDPSKIDKGKGWPNAEEIRKNLAGTSSVTQTTISDVLFGFQLLFGVDYAVTEAMSLGLKGRWVNFSSFSEDRIGWDLLRSHKPNLRKDGSEPVWSGIKTDDIEFFGVSVNLKYHF